MQALVDWHEAARLVRRGEVGVVPTDTLYGIVGLAARPDVVERIYELKERELEKPFITLISSYRDIAALGIRLSEHTHELLKRVWPGPVSVIVPVNDPALEYLHRGTNGLALRMPADPVLRQFLVDAGPVVAPSANPAGLVPAATVQEADAYFGDVVFYVDGGRKEGSASALVDVRGSEPKVLRPAPGFDVSVLQ